MPEPPPGTLTVTSGLDPPAVLTVTPAPVKLSPLTEGSILTLASLISNLESIDTSTLLFKVSSIVFTVVFKPSTKLSLAVSPTAASS